jgi:hypothetical protein
MNLYPVPPVRLSIIARRGTRYRGTPGDANRDMTEPMTTTESASKKGTRGGSQKRAYTVAISGQRLDGGASVQRGLFAPLQGRLRIRAPRHRMHSRDGPERPRSRSVSARRPPLERLGLPFWFYSAPSARELLCPRRTVQARAVAGGAINLARGRKSPWLEHTLGKSPGGDSHRWRAGGSVSEESEELAGHSLCPSSCAQPVPLQSRFCEMRQNRPNE